MLIKDCHIHGNKYNIPEITFSVIADIEENYPILFHNQTILTTYVTEYGHHISIVKIIKHGDEVHFQMKEAHLESMFGTQQQQQPQEEDNGKPRSHIFLDPSTYFIGIGTNERVTKYPVEYATTKPHNIQHVVIKSQTYPNMVNNRIAENFRHINSRNKNYYYFDQFSASTMRRESNLYSFEEMKNHTENASETEGYEKKYGCIHTRSIKISKKAKKMVESITAPQSSISKAIAESDADDSIATSIKKEVNEEVKRLDKIAELETQLAELKAQEKEDATLDDKAFREVFTKEITEYVKEAEATDLVELYNKFSANEVDMNEDSFVIRTPETNEIIADAEKAEAPEEEVLAALLEKAGGRGGRGREVALAVLAQHLQQPLHPPVQPLDQPQAAVVHLAVVGHHPGVLVEAVHHPGVTRPLRVAAQQPLEEGYSYGQSNCALRPKAHFALGNLSSFVPTLSSIVPTSAESDRIHGEAPFLVLVDAGLLHEVQ